MVGLQSTRHMRIGKLVFAAMLSVFLAFTGMAQVPASDPYASAKQFANQQGKDWIERGIPGLSLTITVDGKILYSEGFGFADDEIPHRQHFKTADRRGSDAAC